MSNGFQENKIQAGCHHGVQGLRGRERQHHRTWQPQTHMHTHSTWDSIDGPERLHQPQTHSFYKLSHPPWRFGQIRDIFYCQSICLISFERVQTASCECSNCTGSTVAAPCTANIDWILVFEFSVMKGGSQTCSLYTLSFSNGSFPRVDSGKCV